MKTEGRVFFIQEGTARFNTEPAKRFGRRIFLKSTASPFNTDSFLEECIKNLELQKFNPDTDFIALTGPSLNIALFLGAVMTVYERLNV